MDEGGSGNGGFHHRPFRPLPSLLPDGRKENSVYPPLQGPQRLGPGLSQGRGGRAGDLAPELQNKRGPAMGGPLLFQTNSAISLSSAIYTARSPRPIAQSSPHPATWHCRPRIAPHSSAPAWSLSCAFGRGGKSERAAFCAARNRAGACTSFLRR